MCDSQQKLLYKTKKAGSSADLIWRNGTPLHVHASSITIPHHNVDTPRLTPGCERGLLDHILSARQFEHFFLGLTFLLPSCVLRESIHTRYLDLLPASCFFYFKVKEHIRLDSWLSSILSRGHQKARTGLSVFLLSLGDLFNVLNKTVPADMSAATRFIIITALRQLFVFPIKLTIFICFAA